MSRPPLLCEEGNVAHTLADTDQRPIEGNQEQKHQDLGYEKEPAQFQYVAGTETAERIAGDQNQRLVYEELASYRERPDHPDGERVEAMVQCKLHERRHRDRDHCSFGSQHQMSDKSSP